MQDRLEYIKLAIELSRKSVDAGGGPFGAVIVKNGAVIGSGSNSVVPENDPTAHAEVLAIRDACRSLGVFNLESAVLYTSCEPCPMCLGAIYWAGIKEVYYANTRSDATQAGFGDSFIYDQIPLDPENRTIPSFQIKDVRPEALKVFGMWDNKDNKTKY